MYEKLRTYILPQLISQNVKVLVAVSGGPDSMALSHILWRYMHEEPLNRISLILTHVHHGVRQESDDEAHMVQTMAAQWGLPCLVHRFDAKKYAKTMGQSFQEAAREWRYARWREDMREEGCDLLATAHHLGDQAETILYRLLRGSGTAGLGGIYPSKGSLIRPLLTFGKTEILNYCRQEALPYALDRSNEEPVYIRNRIRLELLPKLEKDYNPRIQEVLGRTGELLRWDEEYLTLQTEQAWKRYQLKGPEGTCGLRREIFTEPAALLSRLLRKAARQVSQEPRGLGFAYVAKIMNSQGKLGWMQDLPGMTVNISNQGIWFTRNAFIIRQPGASLNRHDQQKSNHVIPEIALNIGQWFEIPSANLDIGLLEEWDPSSANEPFNKYEDKVAIFSRELLAQLSKPLVCRTRRQGDKMWFQGVGHKSVKKVFQEENIDAEVRNALPLIACGTEVLWIPGVRRGSLCQPDQNCARVYCVLRLRAAVSSGF